MTIRQPRYSKEEFAQRGKAIYEAQVRSQVEEGNFRILHIRHSSQSAIGEASDDPDAS